MIYVWCIQYMPHFKGLYSYIHRVRVHPDDEYTRRVHYTRDVDAETSGVRAGEGVILPSLKGITSTEARLHSVWSTAPQCLEHGSTVFGARLHSVWSTAPQCLEHGSTVFGARLHSVWSTAPHCLEHGSTLFGAVLYVSVTRPC